MNDVFICYSPEDESTASDICTLLENNSYKCWYKKRDYSETDSVIKITEAVRDSRSLLLIYSKDAKDSNFVTTEVDIAFSSDVPIFVFSIDDSEIDEKLQFYLKDKPTINAYPNAQEHYGEVLSHANEYLGEGSENDVAAASDKNDAYICYADEDVLTAEAIVHALEENGIRCWFKNRDLKANETMQKVSETIKNSKSFILVYSDSASKSNFVKTDTDLAISANIPILSFKIDDSEKSEKLSDSHWLDAYPNPEDNFRELVTNTGKIIGKPISDPKITENYDELKKVEKKVEKENNPISKSDYTSKEVTDKGMGKYFKIIAVVVVIIAIVAGASYFLTSTTTDISSEVNIPEGFVELENASYTENDNDGYTEYKFYESTENELDYFDVLVIHSNSGLGLSNEPGDVEKTINGVTGKYNADMNSFTYIDAKGNMISISSPNEDILSQVVK
jgi:hypothetical protein